MARRRQIQVDFGPIMSLLNQQYQTKKMYENDLLLQQRAEEANRRLVDREATNRNAANAQADAAAKRAFEREQYAKAQGDPALALKWRNYKSDDPSLDFSKLGDDPTTFLAKQGSRVGSAKTIPDIPSMEGLRSEFQAGTGRPTTGAEALTQMAGAFNRKKGLLAEEDRAREETFKNTPVDLRSIDDQGNEVSNYQTQADALKVGQRATGLTSAQNASRTGAAAGAIAAAQQAVDYSPAGIEGAGKKAESVAAGTERGRGPTFEEGKAVSPYLRLLNAHNNLTKLENDPEFSAAKSMYSPDWWSTDKAKQYYQAMQEFVGSMRTETGANLPEPEMKNVRAQGTAVPWGGIDAIKAAQNSRMELIKGQSYIARKGMADFLRRGGSAPKAVNPATMPPKSGETLPDPNDPGGAPDMPPITAVPPGSTLDRLRNRNGRSGR